MGVVSKLISLGGDPVYDLEFDEHEDHFSKQVGVMGIHIGLDFIHAYWKVRDEVDQCAREKMAL